MFKFYSGAASVYLVFIEIVASFSVTCWSWICSIDDSSESSLSKARLMRSFLYVSASGLCTRWMGGLTYFSLIEDYYCSESKSPETSLKISVLQRTSTFSANLIFLSTGLNATELIPDWSLLSCKPDVWSFPAIFTVWETRDASRIDVSASDLELS